MALSTNINNSVRTALIDEYEKQAAKRIHMVKWSIPVRWRPSAGKLADILINRGIGSGVEAREFIRAQFDILTNKFCNEVFKLNYPPLPMLSTFKAHTRYDKRRLATESFNTTKSDDDIKSSLVSELSSIAGVEMDVPRLHFAMLSGVIGFNTLAYLFLSGKITRSDANIVCGFNYNSNTNNTEMFEKAIGIMRRIGVN